MNLPLNKTDHSKLCQYSIRLIERLKLLDTRGVLDFDLIHKAIYWAKKYHGDQLRKSGEPYYTHPLEVAYMISEYNLTTNVIVTAILHDIVEDTEVTASMILDEFGRRIEEMVDRLTRDRPDGSKLSVEEILNNAYEKNDKDVLLIKVIDRMHNMMTIGCMSDEKQKKEAQETLDHMMGYLINIDNKKLEEKLCLISYKLIATKEEYESCFKRYNPDCFSYNLPPYLSFLGF
jgi:(p)ppGpp synthase/HD superfamily hydrolase